MRSRYEEEECSGDEGSSEDYCGGIKAERLSKEAEESRERKGKAVRMGIKGDKSKWREKAAEGNTFLLIRL